MSGSSVSRGFVLFLAVAPRRNTSAGRCVMRILQQGRVRSETLVPAPSPASTVPHRRNESAAAENPYPDPLPPGRGNGSGQPRLRRNRSRNRSATRQRLDCTDRGTPCPHSTQPHQHLEMIGRSGGGRSHRGSDEGERTREGEHPEVREHARVRRLMARNRRSERSGGTDDRVPAHLSLPAAPSITISPP